MHRNPTSLFKLRIKGEMYTKSNSNLVNLLLFASCVVSLHLAAAKSLKDDINSKKSSDSISDESTERPDDENEVKSYFRIRSEFGGKRALDISKRYAGSILILQDPKNTESQLWYIDNDGMTIRSKLYDMCLISNGPYPAMVTWGPCGPQGNQFFQNIHNQIEMYKDDACLDISAGNDTLGGYVMAKKCYRSDSKRFNQKWNFESINNPETAGGMIPNQLYVIRTQMNSKVLEAPKKNTHSTGTGVVINDYIKDAITQKWYTGADDNVIRSALNDNCLVSNGFPALVTLELCDSRLDNKWVFNSLTQRIELATSSSRCLDVIRHDCGNNRNILGCNVTEYSCHGGSNQKWTLETDDPMV